MQRLLDIINRVGNYFAIGIFWFAHWFYRAVVFSLVGGIIGLFVTPFVKLIFFSNNPWSQSLLTGFVTGCQYAGIWASGVALVWVIMSRKRIIRAVVKQLATESKTGENL